MKVLMSGLSNDMVDLNLAKSLVKNGIDLFIMATEGSKAVAMCQENGIPFAVNVFKNRIDRKTIELYRSLQKEHQFDVFHCLTNRALSTGLIARKRINPRPAIVAYRGTSGHLSRFDPAAHMSYLNRNLDCIICVSHAVRSYLKKFRIPDSRLEVIWKGHDPSWYSPAPRSRLADFGIPLDATVVCFTGNIRPVKGVNYLLEAFSRISEREKLHLLIIGEIRDEEIKKKIDQNKLVHAAGYLPDATSVAGACDIAVMPSIEREGLPKAVLESMAQGIPAVVTDIGGMPELVITNECGIVVPPRNGRAIYSAIKKLETNKVWRKKLGAAARARIEGEFNFRHTVEKTIALYEHVRKR